MMLSHNYSVYILQCSDHSYYIGVTNDLERRLWEHQTGFNETCYTYKRRPVILKYYETTKDIKQAILREKQLKGWGRKKKEALFREDWDELKELSKSYQSKIQANPSTSSGRQTKAKVMMKILLLKAVRLSLSKTGIIANTFRQAQGDRQKRK